MMENRFLEEVCELRNEVEKNGENVYNEERLRKAFLDSYSSSPDNVSAIAQIEYGSATKSYEPDIETFGLKIKGKNISIADLAYELECSKISGFLQELFPELSLEEIEGAQRIMTTVMLSLEFRKRMK